MTSHLTRSGRRNNGHQEVKIPPRIPPIRTKATAKRLPTCSTCVQKISKTPQLSKKNMPLLDQVNSLPSSLPGALPGDHLPTLSPGIFQLTNQHQGLINAWMRTATGILQLATQRLIACSESGRQEAGRFSLCLFSACCRMLS